MYCGSLNIFTVYYISFVYDSTDLDFLSLLINLAKGLLIFTKNQLCLIEYLYFFLFHFVNISPFYYLPPSILLVCLMSPNDLLLSHEQGHLLVLIQKAFFPAVDCNQHRNIKLINMERIKDNGELGPKWDKHITSLIKRLRIFIQEKGEERL